MEEEPILLAHYKGLYAALCAVIGQLQPPVLQIAHQIRPLFSQIVQRLAQGRLGRRLGTGILSPRQQSVQNWSFQFQTLVVSFFCCQYKR